MSLPSAAAKASALDFQGFSALRRVSRERAEQGATLVARQFEGIILQTMLRTMRQGLPGDPPASTLDEGNRLAAAESDHGNPR